MVKCLPAMQETWVRSLGGEDPLEKEMAIHSSTLAWKIPWTEEPDRLQSMGLQSRTWLSNFTSLLVCMHSGLCCAVLCLVAQSCLTLCDPEDCSLPGSFVHGILQARILEWIAMPSSRGSSQPRDQTQTLPHCRQILYCLSHQGSPRLLEWVA